MTLLYLFISPHLDDVVLSCGGYVRRLAAAGEDVLIATLVTADVPSGTPLSWLMQRNHMAWRLGDAPFSARREEDAQAAQALGARKAHLDLLDAMYRRDAAGQVLYSKDTVRVPVHPDDWKCYEPAVRQRLQEILSNHAGGGAQVFCPLAVGEHVDHIIVRRAVEESYFPRQITYYEDYPYADKLDDVRAKLGLDGRLETWESVTVDLTRDEAQARIAAIACYRSQLRGLFPSALDRWQEIGRARLPLLGRYLDWPADPRTSCERMASSVEAFIARVGGERYWRRRE